MPQVKQLVTKNEFNAFPTSEMKWRVTHREVAFVAPGFSPAFPLFVGQPFLAVLLSPHLASIATPSYPHQAPPVVRAFCVPDDSAGSSGASRLFVPASFLRSKIPIRSESGRLAQRDRFLSAVYAEKSLFSSGTAPIHLLDCSRSAGLQPGISPFVAQPLLAVLLPLKQRQQETWPLRPPEFN